MKLEITAPIVKQGNGHYVLIKKAVLDAIGKCVGDTITIEIKK